MARAKLADELLLDYSQSRGPSVHYSAFHQGPSFCLGPLTRRVTGLRRAFCFQFIEKKSNQLKRPAIIRLHTDVFTRRLRDSVDLTKWQRRLTQQISKSPEKQHRGQIVCKCATCR